MSETTSTLADLISPESRNILEKYRNLSRLTKEIGIKEDKWNDLIFLSKELPKISHKNKDEAINLVNKLLKIKK
jgi:hypothetical protein